MFKPQTCLLTIGLLLVQSVAQAEPVQDLGTQQLRLVAETLGPNLEALAAQAREDETVNAAIESVENYYLTKVLPQFEVDPTLRAASRAVSNAKNEIAGKLGLRGGTSAANRDLQSNFGQNRLPLPTSLRGD